MAKKSKDTGIVIAAMINAAGIVAAAIITSIFAYLSAAASWQLSARANGWIPRSECQWQPTISTGKDASGKSIRVRINILSEEFRWLFNSASQVEVGGEVEDLQPHLARLDVSKSQALVCVGAASFEGERHEQGILARDRADKLLSLARETFRSMPMYGLNLGRYRIESQSIRTPRETATQRRVILVEIVEREEGVKLSEALLDAFIAASQATPPIAFDVRDYFEFDLYTAQF